MNRGLENNSPVFENIKRSLDPAYSYMIFEKAIKSTDTDTFQEIISRLSRLDLKIFECRIHHDEANGLALLVVKVDQDRTDNIVQKVLNIGIPNNFIFYSYGKRIEV